MHDLTPPALRWLADHHGVITTAELRRCGVQRSTIRRLVGGGTFRTIHRGVLLLATAPLSLEQRCMVLCTAYPTGFVTGPTAGALLNLRRMPRSCALHFAVRHGVHLAKQPGVRYRQTTTLPSSHRRTRRDGITVATPGRLAFDLAADLSPLDHLSIVHQLLDDGRVTVDELAIAAELCHPARAGSAQFRVVLQQIATGAPAQSHHEVLLADALLGRGVPVERQSRVVPGLGGRLVRIDLAVPSIRWGIELDIHPEHRSVEGHANDARRYRSLHFIEWQIEPVTEVDMSDVDAVSDELATLYRARIDRVSERQDG